MPFTVLQASTICIIALGGRLPQILLNMRRGGSGELSLTTCLLNLMGNITRVVLDKLHGLRCCRDCACTMECNELTRLHPLPIATGAYREE